MFNSHLFDNYLVKVCFAAVIAIGLAACSSSDSDDPPADDMSPAEEVMDPEPAEPTDLENTQAAALAAAEAAKEASDAAGMAADGAEEATANLATLQTGEMAATHAMAASDAAATAMAAYMDAKDASDAAAEAELASEAGMALADAEAAQIAAEAAQEDAEAAAEMATEAAAMELKIDGTVKSVGDSSVDAMAGASSETTGSGDDAMTVVTGLIESMNPMAQGAIVDGQAFAAGTPDDLTTAADESTPDTPYRQAAAAREFDVGKTLDSSDDMARLMIVTDYAGTVMVNVYAPGGAGATPVTGSKPGRVSISDGDDDTDDTNNTALRSEGMFVPVDGTDGTLAATDLVDAEAEPVEVFSYMTATGRAYVTLTTTTTAGDTTTYTYATGHDVTGVTGVDGPDAGGDPDESRIVAGVPGPVAYEHLHFGV